MGRETLTLGDIDIEKRFFTTLRLSFFKKCRY